MAEGTYDMWTMDPADTESMASFGGIMQIAEGMPIQDEKWVPYFMVADADATVDRTVAAGGMVLMPAADAPPGRLAALTDQFGARFNLLKPAPMETPAG
jgi:predicted enzyme related to lactoylglutathione lyase